MAATNAAILLILFLALGVTLQHWVPLPALKGLPALAVGLLVFMPGAGIGLAIFELVRQARKMPEARRRKLIITQEGPYRLSRNPFYLALVIQYAGMAILLETLWPLLMLPLVIWMLNRWTIIPQEREFEIRFGEEYNRYKNRVRRWL